jgi:VanZ family protein
MPGAVKEEAKNEILSQAHAYAHQVVESGGAPVRTLAEELKAEKWLEIDITKVAHLLLFALFGGLLYVRQGRGTIWRTLVDTGMLACGTELVQLFIDDRSALVGDVVLDMVGVGCAVVICHVYERGQGVGDRSLRKR